MFLILSINVYDLSDVNLFNLFAHSQEVSENSLFSATTTIYREERHYPDGAPTARACAELAAERNLYLVTLSEALDGDFGAGIELAAETPELRRELMLMACHCLQGEIRHLLMGD